MTDRPAPAAAKPFLKWAGGKGRLLPQLRAYYPDALAKGQVRRYVEPFVGGGAVFLDVVQRYPIEHAVLIDVNPEVALAYRVVQQSPDALIERLRQHCAEYLVLSEPEREQYYYATRTAYNAERDRINRASLSNGAIERAAQTLFMNKTCYNGLSRVNARGEFNVPFGRYRRPRILDEDNLRRVSELLQVADIVVGDFGQAAAFVDDRTFCYFDPPYRPLNATSSFTSYARHRFDDDDQRTLGALFTELDRGSGACLMLSNSDPTNEDPGDRFFEDLYASFYIHRVHANRMINTRADRRKKIRELLVTNYPVGTETV